MTTNDITPGRPICPTPCRSFFCGKIECPDDCRYLPAQMLYRSKKAEYQRRLDERGGAGS